MKTTTKLNFGGFYESEHSYNIDTYIECLGLELNDIEYKDLLNNYCQNYVTMLNCELGTNIEFVKLQSPLYYNFSTDYIEVNIDTKDILKVIEYIKEDFKSYQDLSYKEELRNLISECTTPKDGYVPYYSYKDFLKKDNRAILFECILDLLLKTDVPTNILYDIEIDY